MKIPSSEDDCDIGDLGRTKPVARANLDGFWARNMLGRGMRLITPSRRGIRDFDGSLFYEIYIV